MRPVPSAGKHAAGVKRRETCDWCQARENMQLVLNAGKHVTGLWVWLNPVPSAGKHT